MWKAIAVVLSVVIVTVGGMLMLVRGCDSMLGNVPIRFYGRVVDDQGAALPEVVVTAEITAVAYGTNPGWPRYERQTLTATTDADGRFSFAARRGHFFNIKSFDKPRWRLAAEGRGMTTQFNYEAGAGKPPTDPKRPAVYTMSPINRATTRPLEATMTSR